MTQPKPGMNDPVEGREPVVGESAGVHDDSTDPSPPGAGASDDAADAESDADPEASGTDPESRSDSDSDSDSDPSDQFAPPELLAELIDEHSAAAYRVAIFIVRDPALAEDVVQETMISVWQKYGSFRGDSPIRGWILRIAHNTAVSRLRKIKDESWDPATLPDQVGRADVERTVEGREDLVVLGQALEELDELSRSIVVLREVEGLTYEEIAEALEITLPTVKTRLLRARRSLQASLQEVSP